MRKFLSLSCVCIFIFSLCACLNKNKVSDNKKSISSNTIKDSITGVFWKYDLELSFTVMNLKSGKYKEDTFIYHYKIVVDFFNTYPNYKEENEIDLSFYFDNDKVHFYSGGNYVASNDYSITGNLISVSNGGGMGITSFLRYDAYLDAIILGDSDELQMYFTRK